MLAEPWSIVCDALIYQHADVPMPDELIDAAEHAGMVLTSLALVKSGELEFDELDALWERDPLEWRFTWQEVDESLCVEAVFGDGEEPGSVKTTARGLGGKLNEFMRLHAMAGSVCRRCNAPIYKTEGGLWVTGPAVADDVCVLELDGTTWAHVPSDATDVDINQP